MGHCRKVRSDVRRSWCSTRLRVNLHFYSYAEHRSEGFHFAENRPCTFSCSSNTSARRKASLDTREDLLLRVRAEHARAILNFPSIFAHIPTPPPKLTRICLKPPRKRTAEDWLVIARISFVRNSSHGEEDQSVGGAAWMGTSTPSRRPVRGQRSRTETSRARSRFDQRTCRGSKEVPRGTSSNKRQTISPFVGVRVVVRSGRCSCIQKLRRAPKCGLSPFRGMDGRKRSMGKLRGVCFGRCQKLGKLPRLSALVLLASVRRYFPSMTRTSSESPLL